MESREKTDKITRVLSLYTRLLAGQTINKAEAAEDYGTSWRSIQRDISDIRGYLENQPEDGYYNAVLYDQHRGGYYLDQTYGTNFTNAEILAVCKILLDSRAFTKEEMTGLLNKLIAGCVPKANQELVASLVKNEEYHYVEPRHGKSFIDKLWLIAGAIRGHRYVEIQYHRLKGSDTVSRRVKPVGIMFSEFYFYMCAFIEDEDVEDKHYTIEDANPTIYRIDRIEKLEVTDERFQMPYSKRFEEGEFRKRMQFMFGGKLKRVTFKYTGMSIESVLDRLPTAKILEEKDGAYLVSAEVYGDGIDYWLKGQGENVEMI